MQSVSPRRHSLKQAESLLQPMKHSIISFSQFSMQSLRKSGTLKSQMNSNMGGVPTQSGKGCERRQIMCLVLQFSRGYSQF